MLRVFVGGLLAAVVVFAYLMASWMVFDFHRGTILPLPESWRDAFAAQEPIVQSGVYAEPMPPEPDPAASPEETQRRLDEFLARHRRGPLVTVFYRREGAEPFSPLLLVQGFGLDVIAAWIAGLILFLGRAAFYSYPQRVVVVALMGAFTAVVAHGGYFVWMSFEWGFTLAMACDVIVSWLLAGLVLAAIVKETPTDLRDHRPLLRPPGVEDSPRP